MTLESFECNFVIRILRYKTLSWHSGPSYSLLVILLITDQSRIFIGQ